MTFHLFKELSRSLYFCEGEEMAAAHVSSDISIQVLDYWIKISGIFNRSNYRIILMLLYACKD